MTRGAAAMDSSSVDPGLDEHDPELVAVFRAASLQEAKRAAKALADHGMDCDIDRGLGVGYVEVTDHLAFEDMASFEVVVEDRAEKDQRVKR